MTATIDEIIVLDISCLWIELVPQGSRLVYLQLPFVLPYVICILFDAQYEVATSSKASSLAEQTQIFERGITLGRI